MATPFDLLGGVGGETLPGSAVTPAATQGPPTLGYDQGVFGGIKNFLYGPREGRYPELYDRALQQENSRASARIQSELSDRVQNKGMTYPAALVDFLGSPMGVELFSRDNGTLMKGIQEFVKGMSPETKIVPPAHGVVQTDPRTNKTEAKYTQPEYASVPVTDLYNGTIGFIVFDRSTGRIVHSTSGQYKPGDTAPPSLRSPAPGAPTAPSTPPPGTAAPPPARGVTPPAPRTDLAPPTKTPAQQADEAAAFLKQGETGPTFVQQNQTRTPLVPFDATTNPRGTLTPDDSRRAGSDMRMAQDPNAPATPGLEYNPTRVYPAQPPKEATDQLSLRASVKGVTGIAASIKERVQGFTGQAGIDTTSPEFRRARANFELTERNFISSMALNRRFAQGEMDHIRENTSFGPGFFTDEKTMYSKLDQIEAYASSWINKLEKEWRDPKTPIEKRKEIASSIQDFRYLKERIGPKEDERPASTLKEQADDVISIFRGGREKMRQIQGAQPKAAADAHFNRMLKVYSSGGNATMEDLVKLTPEQRLQLQLARNNRQKKP